MTLNVTTCCPRRRRRRRKTPSRRSCINIDTSCRIIALIIPIVAFLFLAPTTITTTIPSVSSFVFSPTTTTSVVTTTSRGGMLSRCSNLNNKNNLPARILLNSPFVGRTSTRSSQKEINNPTCSYYLSSPSSSSILRLFSSSSSNNNNNGNNFINNEIDNNTTTCTKLNNIQPPSSSSKLTNQEDLSSMSPPHYSKEENDDNDNDDRLIIESIINPSSNGDDDDDDDDNVVVVEDNDDSDDSDDSDDYRNLPKGSNDGFYVVKIMETPKSGFDMPSIKSVISDADIERTNINPTNITVPVALMILDPEEYPALSRARKACRRQNIMIHRGPLLKIIHQNNESKTKKSNNNTGVFQYENCKTAKVGDRVYPGDVLAKQTRMADGYYPTMFYEKPPFDLPVVYEDDHFAIVNKPAGVVVYAHKKGGHGTMTVMAGLPFAVQPPRAGTYSTMRLPKAVHRLDKPTSGLLVVAKTKPAMVHLSLQFRDRKVKKTYVAIVNGIPPELPENAVSSQEAYELGVDVDPNDDSSSTKWQLIDHPLDGKSATTIWRAVKYSKSLRANDNYLTMVELKPKSGRFHQLRRHMAWVCERPIIGDHEYDGGRPDAINLRERGLFLCSNRVTLEHPFYNTDTGRKVYDQLSESEKADLSQKGVTLVVSSSKDEDSSSDDGNSNSSNNNSSNNNSSKVMLSVEIDIPNKFDSFLDHENSRYERLSSTSPSASASASASSTDEEEEATTLL